MTTKSMRITSQVNQEVHLQLPHREASALPTLCEENGKLLRQPAVMVAVAQIAKTRYPASVNGAGLRPIAP